MLLTLLFTCLAFFDLGEFGLFIYSSCLSNHCQDLRRSFPEICAKFDVVPLSDSTRILIRPDTRLQIKRRNNQQVHPAT
jgi:hypothetical protein